MQRVADRGKIFTPNSWSRDFEPRVSLESFHMNTATLVFRRDEDASSGGRVPSRTRHCGNTGCAASSSQSTTWTHQ